MCGIAGIMMRDGSTPNTDILDKLANAISHRGPDGQGCHISGTIGLIQTRLAIIDLSTGDQPLYDKDGSGSVLIGNGEIYNYLELRNELGREKFSTNSDCEVPLQTYLRDGVTYADKLRGMYALAIHDPNENKLVITRDPFGIKPLYYVEQENYFAFASEAQALINADLVVPIVSDRKQQELLQLQFTCGQNTIYENIKRVWPGETIIIQAGRIVERHLRPALPQRKPQTITEKDALSKLDEILHTTIDIHQRSDVPYGLFLSGGIDSTILLSLMAELNDKPVVAYTAGFSDTQVHDERDHARMLASVTGADHHEINFGEEDFWLTLPQIAASMDDPAADYAILPTWKLAKAAAQDLKVVLSGEGGDELFAGYGRYRSVMRPWWLGGRNVRHRGIFDNMNILHDNSTSWRDRITSHEAVSTNSGCNKLQTAQAVDCADWLPNDLLTKLDRCLMAHGLEGRTPFLDPVVAEFAYLLPDKLKVKGRLGKWLLRSWLEKRMPEAKPFDKKRGFTVPVGEWILNRGKILGGLVAKQESIKEIADVSAVEKLFITEGKREAFAAWSLLFYALWHKANIEQINPNNKNIFDALEG
ncbi:asparagine synthase (glutamine-hydrolyzing) [Curvivirga aplysinae]|uniref:asparagine synthase (glutamine-hydrolyzing) n=1 Tax=Curvivirga aplysinae TaxID=2529852 RepID=UPI0012BC5089|nr:asparagine synthase (glutamine-hydrolyzing) [Curvivirga aplysinae]MTI10423.1 asparagine synthase (glutamine-hydrolyzing) [Curvivirga aplysinae]